MIANKKLRDEIFSADCVVGPAMGAITLAHEMARSLSKETDKPVFRSYVEKKDDGTMGFKKATFKQGSIVVLIEDVITTGISTRKTAEAVTQAGGKIIPIVLCLVNRSGQEVIDDRTVVSLISKDLPTWAPEKCPLCEQGSEAIRPKGENWKRLTAKY
jgi:orotate phosphoribosyltransferase